MKITITPTGYAPFDVEYTASFTATQSVEGEKRGVRIDLYRTTQRDWVGQIVYLTQWGSERQFTSVSPFGTLDQFADWARTKSESILPPGAGFPAMPQFETRQSKLKGMLQTLTLVALTDVLTQATS